MAVRGAGTNVQGTRNVRNLRDGHRMRGGLAPSDRRPSIGILLRGRGVSGNVLKAPARPDETGWGGASECTSRLLAHELLHRSGS